MRAELRWGLIALGALAIGSACAEGYARLASPYYAAVARFIAGGHPWNIVAVGVRPGDAGQGAALTLVGDVWRRADDARPAAIVVARVNVGAVIEAPIVFWTLLLFWPAACVRQRLMRCLVGIPIFLGLESITTVAQLLRDLPQVSAMLAGARDSLTLLDRWSRFLETGGRFALPVCAALLAIVTTRWLQPDVSPAGLETSPTSPP